MAGSGLSGTAGSLTAPLRGRHSRREDGRLPGGDGQGLRMAASAGCIRLYACRNLKQQQDVLVELMAVGSRTKIQIPGNVSSLWLGSLMTSSDETSSSLLRQRLRLSLGRHSIESVQNSNQTV